MEKKKQNKAKLITLAEEESKDNREQRIRKIAVERHERLIREIQDAFVDGPWTAPAIAYGDMLTACMLVGLDVENHCSDAIITAKEAGIELFRKMLLTPPQPQLDASRIVSAIPNLTGRRSRN